jgi:hypothetical protein
MNELRTYLHLREWGELRYLLDLPPMMLVWVGMIVLGLVMAPSGYGRMGLQRSSWKDSRAA